ncbi:cobyrinate a,c-diamide synthase [Undibacterium griseum]|uniref:Cobyrinate a,c-diamide synthase n=1 Tax=Undibacterium griseum TaxID=2762295 RepID=A0ABR6YRQ7_9BURK|nr:cobyrinate a,c-diamide synthase [Undibacterium griseum]MBC3886590.1 cobyrinate a,c-diamide synthase [Undibacterium griseum]
MAGALGSAPPVAASATVSAKVVLVSAIASGQGKTTTTAALARKLVQQGQRVRVFKTGPDFIDPMILERAGGAAVYSLDLWMVGESASRQMLAQAASQADVILIEGVMGLYDGNPSSADLARAFGVPVIAVLDASAMAQTVGALALGLRDFGPVQLTGVIANRIASAGHAGMVAAAMRDIPLLGSLARQQHTLPERHLGLVLPDEVTQIDALLDQLAAQLELSPDAWEKLPRTTFELMPEPAPATLLSGKTIAIARDAAFSFLYPANLRCLREQGAELVFFSPLADECIPPQADALYLPGGYPELHAAALSKAQCWQDSVRQAWLDDMPMLAECGGMMALTEGLTDQQGQHWPMAGLLSGQVIMQQRLAALGGQAWQMPQGELRGHTFHYSRFETTLTPAQHTCKHQRGVLEGVGEAIYRSRQLHASYFHAYFGSSPCAAASLFLRDGA